MRAYIESNPPINILAYLAGIFKSGNNFSDVLLTSRGRDAIQLAFNYLELKNDDTVLLPALTCDTVTGIFSGNCSEIFYDLNEDYSIDISALEQILSKNREIKLVYVIHYFGFIQKNIQQISSLCKKYDITLIEDHAHSALSEYRRDFSDIQIYSFRKLFHTADGGGIRMGTGKKKINYKFKLKNKIIANIKGFLIAVKRIGSLYSKKIRSAFGKVIQSEIDEMAEGNTKIDPLPVSAFGRGIISSADMDKICEVRRRLYVKWNEIIDSTPFDPVFPDLDSETVPFGFPIRMQNNIEVADHFKAFNIFLKIHWLTLPSGTKETCPISHHLAGTSLTLPIYPGLKESQMYFIKDQLVKFGIPL